MPYIKKILFIIIVSKVIFAQTFSGNFESYSRNNNSVNIRTSNSIVNFFFYAPGIIRIDYLPSHETKIDTSFAVIRQVPAKYDFKVEETDSLLEIYTNDVRIECIKFPLSISYYNSDSVEILSEPVSGGFSFQSDVRSVKYSMNYKNHFYGTGERGTDLDKRGQKFECYNTQIGGYDSPLSTMNLNVPFFCTTNGFALYFDNTYKSVFDFGGTDSSIFSFTAAGGDISIYLIVDSTVPGQLEKYTWLTGRQPLPPRWAFGFIQSKNRYQNEAELRSIVDTMRRKQFPCDAVVIDLGWFEHMGDISWNESAWPEHDKMVEDFMAKGIKTILITEPYIIEHSKNFKTAYENGYLAKDSTDKPFLFEKWWSCRGCNAALLDITDPKAAYWWWNLHPKAFRNIAGIWTDLGEPERHPEGLKHFLGSTIKIHNIYNLLWAKSIFDGFNTLHPNKRVFNLTRSGFAGIQRYGALPWSGDVARNFGGLSVQPVMLLGMGLSGLAYHNSDIGGYSRIQGSPELYSRWMAFGIFCALTRVHGAGESVKGFPTEPWRYGPETERISRDYLKLRYSLLPYIYTLAYQNYLTGIPFARPLFFMDPSDENLRNESSSFLFGDALLVSPVIEAGINEKEIYLPRGNWINFWTDEILAGSSNIRTSAPLDKIPLFVKEGSIIPTAPVMNFTDERPLDTLIVHVYPSKDSTYFTMYEDDGKSLEYQKGAFAKTTFFQYLMRDEVLALGSTSTDGEFEGQLTERILRFQIHLIKKAPISVLLNDHKIEKLSSNQQFFNNEQGYFFDQNKGMLYIQAKKKLEDDNHWKILF